MVQCGQLSEPDEHNLRALEKHILVSYKRIQALQKLQPWPQVNLSTSSSQNSLLKIRDAPKGSYSDLDRKILQLCGELYDLDAASLQLKVINYLVSSQAIVFPITMYGCESWAVKEVNKKKINSFEMWLEKSAEDTVDGQEDQ
ncbi:hypothetical protein JD844_033794 [Phrynosoma platyrhinos]|uniref:Uncharacterized protein n=1 Tax=Phrynosoma platyrhinos TaxID=52577 RepID=A0ABQ7T6C8_PHRPL|nr:hypothetical protein JD844_033794 [Phrynosoma platyrhinos]